MQKSNKAHQTHPAAVLCGKWYCINCGLMRLNNEATRKAWEKNCPGSPADQPADVKVIRK